MIFNLRGTNGSGKSTVARWLLEDGFPDDPQEIELPSGVTAYRVPSLNLTVVGPYRTDCGGCDSLKTQNHVLAAVRYAVAQGGPEGHVFFEGVIVSTIFQGYRDLSMRLSREFGPFRGKLVWGYLDTPADVCIARIQARNGGKPIKEGLVLDKIKSIGATRSKARASGEKVVDVPWQDAQTFVEGYLRNGL